MLNKLDLTGPKIGLQGVCTFAVPSESPEFVLKPLAIPLKYRDLQSLEIKHQEFISKLKNWGVRVPESELDYLSSPTTTHAVIRQRRFEESELATEIISKANPTQALLAAQLVFQTTIDTIKNASNTFSGFHGSLRNFAIVGISGTNPQAFFIDTFPPFSSPKELLSQLSKFGHTSRLRYAAQAALILPDEMLTRHSIFNPVTMLAGICHSVYRRRPEISTAFTTWAISKVEEYNPSYAKDLLSRLEKGFSKDPIYRRLFPFLLRRKYSAS